VAFAIAAILLACRGNLLHVLAGRTFHAGDVAAFTYLVCGFALLAIAIAPYYLLLGMGRSRSVSLIMSTSMAISVVFMPFMIARFGLDGAALARLIYPIGALLLLYNARVTIGIR
jgi:O-antigen/teichoic acid export membrane protein